MIFVHAMAGGDGSLLLTLPFARASLMRIDFLGLEAFLGIATWGSFNRAAGHLNLSQTALSHRLRKLEDDLGVKLLARTTRQVTLTAAGLELLPTAQRIVSELSASLDGLRALGRGRQERLAIGCLPTIAKHHLPRILQEFEAIHPGLTVRVFDNSASEIAERVLTGEAEFGLTIVSTERWDLEITPLLKEPFVLVCRADHPLAGRGAAAWSDLAGVPLIRISQQTGNRLLIDDALGGRREGMTWRYEVQHIATAIGMVQAGVGLTVVPRLGVDLEDAPGLAVVTLRNPGIVRTLGLVARRQQPLSAAAGTLARLVTAHLRRA
jgi:DNA-binding transcriptional LysR family regulator